MRHWIFWASSGVASLGFLSFLYGGQGKGEPKLNDKESQRETEVIKKKIEPNSNDQVPIQHKSTDILTPTDSIQKIRALMLEKGVPGLTISVSKRGKMIWQSAFGYCDVENLLPCDPRASMRIGSVSKSIFAATMVGPLLEANRISLDDTIHKYLTPDELPKLKFSDKEYDITIGQLLSHTSGIRHYVDDLDENRKLLPIGSPRSHKLYQTRDQFNRQGFYQRETFRNVLDALKPFKNDPLVNEPGKLFNYTTYGYTLLSAVIEKVILKYEFLDLNRMDQIEDIWIRRLRRDWNMKSTYLDQDEVLISRRARYYMRTAVNGSLVNAPYQDSSVKWAGGGLVSTTADMVTFGNLLIDSYKGKDGSKLKPETVKLLWTEVSKSYGLGFSLSKDTTSVDKLIAYHTGSAMGASSVLLIYPESELVVAILANFCPVDLVPLAGHIARELKHLA